MAAAKTHCQATGCEREARMAIDTVRNPVLKSTVYFDDREAPKKAVRYCKACGVPLVHDLAQTLVQNDEQKEATDGNG
jgi:hypothetical protein